jgi:hypothetical protein
MTSHGFLSDLDGAVLVARAAETADPERRQQSAISDLVAMVESR